MQFKFEKVSYEYTSLLSNVSALDTIDTTLTANKFYGIVGHTGSGKSTFIQHLNVLLKPTSGKVIIDDLVIETKTKVKDIGKIRKEIGLVMQFSENQLFEETVEKDILFGPSNFGIKNINPAFFLNLVGLDETFLEKTPFNLSGGQMRRVAIAGVLAYNPKFLIVDEPTVGLDPQGKKEIMEMLRYLYESGITIFMITHDMEFLYEYCNYILVFDKAKLVFDDTIDKFVQSDYAVQFSSRTLEFKNQLEKKLNHKFISYKYNDLIKEIGEYYG